MPRISVTRRAYPARGSPRYLVHDEQGRIDRERDVNRGASASMRVLAERLLATAPDPTL